MNLKEPRRKKRTRLQLRAPLPISIDSEGKWVVYTAYLTAFGVYINDPNEIEAVHSMGFFGKGSLSRSFPSFGKSRYGAPPVVRSRQWLRRQEWLKDAKKIESECNTEGFGNEKTITNDNNERKLNVEGKKDVAVDGIRNAAISLDHTPLDCQETNLVHNTSSTHSEQLLRPGESLTKTVEISEIESGPSQGSVEIIKPSPNASEALERQTVVDETVDEVTLDSTEEEDICEIENTESRDRSHDSRFNENEIVLLNDEEIEILNDADDRLDKWRNNDLYRNEKKDNPEPGKVLVLSDSDSEVEDYLKNIRPRIEDDGFPTRETLRLTFEEAFFLMFGLGCLQIVNFNGDLFDIKTAWNYFSGEQEDFVQSYVVYHYFRSKGWVVKPGLKYGGDFLLYKQGPPFYHASYIVIVEVVDADTLMRDNNKTMRKMTWNNLFGLERLSETAAKEVLFAQVLWPSSIPRDIVPPTPEVLSEFVVKEVLWRRWIPNQNREVISLEEEDEDSI